MTTRFVSTALLLTLLFSANPSAAQTNASSSEASSTTSWYQSEQISGDIEVGDFVVGPGRAELTVSPGETIVQEITITNRISDNRTFTLEVEDITGSLDGSSAVSLVPGERGPYSIRDYVSFPENTITLKLGERARVPVTISIPADAEPGGLYGSVLVSTNRTSDDKNTNSSRSPIIARIGSLLFVTVAGEVKRGGETKSIAPISASRFLQSGPVTLGIVYENTGSVHLNPYGEISITNMFGEAVGFVELEPWFVLPQSLRTREVQWDREFLLGRYTVTALINRGYDDVVDEVTTTFWVLPWKIVVGSFAVLFIIIFSIRAFFRTFQFTRKVR